jgi:hypothetical protein
MRTFGSVLIINPVAGSHHEHENDSAAALNEKWKNGDLAGPNSLENTTIQPQQVRDQKAH